MREEFHALEMELPEFTAVLDGMTRNTYILLIVHDPTIGNEPCRFASYQPCEALMCMFFFSFLQRRPR
jgi:hypothetical protein